MRLLLAPALAMLATAMLPAGSTLRTTLPASVPPHAAPSTVAPKSAPTDMSTHLDGQMPRMAPTTDFRRLRLAGPFPAVVTAVIDGDTFEARVTIWLGHEVTTRVRLLGIDAAEMGSECGDERQMAGVARQALAGMLGSRVELSDVRFDKYGGRILARARSDRHADVSGAMLAGGYAIAYEGGRRQAWCETVVTSRR